jgi:hypothetical protein
MKFSIAFGGSFIPLKTDPRFSSYYNNSVNSEFKGVSKNFCRLNFSCSYGVRIKNNTWLSIFRTSYGGISQINIIESQTKMYYVTSGPSVPGTTKKYKRKYVPYMLESYGLKAEQVIVDRILFLSVNINLAIVSKDWAEGLNQKFRRDHMAVGIEPDLGYHFKKERIFITPTLVLPVGSKYSKTVRYDYATLISLGYSHSF